MAPSSSLAFSSSSSATLSFSAAASTTVVASTTAATASETVMANVISSRCEVDDDAEELAAAVIYAMSFVIKLGAAVVAVRTSVAGGNVLDEGSPAGAEEMGEFEAMEME